MMQVLEREKFDTKLKLGKESKIRPTSQQFSLEHINKLIASANLKSKSKSFKEEDKILEAMTTVL